MRETPAIVATRGGEVAGGPEAVLYHCFGVAAMGIILQAQLPDMQAVLVELIPEPLGIQGRQEMREHLLLDYPKHFPAARQEMRAREVRRGILVVAVLQDVRRVLLQAAH